MKKFLLIFGLIIIIVIGFVLYEENSYSPLKEEDFKRLFGVKINYKKECGIDFIGWSFDGSLFDFYVYQVGKIQIQGSYPIFFTDENHSDRQDDNKFLKWKRTPIDSLELSYDLFALNPSVLNSYNCSRGFISNKLMSNTKSYYSYQIIGDRETHFYLYNPSTGRLIYLRRKGW